jgi:cholesterol transport system auxiliary component
MRGCVRATAAALALLLGGCGGLLPAPPPAPALYDFGPPPAVHSASAGNVALAAVSAPTWFARNEIFYRLSYSDPMRLHSYAQHRWVAPPAELCAARLRLLLGASATLPRYLLRLRLESFEQDFSSPTHAYVSMVLTAELRDAASGRRLAVRQFHATTPASANVQGAVDGLSALADDTLARVVEWAERSSRTPH